MLVENSLFYASNYHKYERGKDNPPIKTVLKKASAFGIPVVSSHFQYNSKVEFFLDIVLLLVDVGRGKEPEVLCTMTSRSALRSPANSFKIPAIFPHQYLSGTHLWLTSLPDSETQASSD